eukprot:scaffold296188_cov32-Attheya_sp.AAC.1
MISIPSAVSDRYAYAGSRYSEVSGGRYGFLLSALMGAAFVRLFVCSVYSSLLLLSFCSVDTVDVFQPQM